MIIVFFKQKTANERRISDWSSDVCSSDLWNSRPGTAGWPSCGMPGGRMLRLAGGATCTSRSRPYRTAPVSISRSVHASWVCAGYASSRELACSPSRTPGTRGRHARTASTMQETYKTAPCARPDAGTMPESLHPSPTPAEAAEAAEPVRFDTKVAVVLRDDLLPWQELNVTAFLMTGIATSDEGLVGEPYEDADRSEERRVGKECVRPCRSRW